MTVDNHTIQNTTPQPVTFGGVHIPGGTTSGEIDFNLLSLGEWDTLTAMGPSGSAVLVYSPGWTQPASPPTLAEQVATNTAAIAAEATALTTEATARAAGDTTNATNLTTLQTALTSGPFPTGPTGPVKVPSYLVSALPVSPAVGTLAYATNGLKVGETMGTGTGVVVYYSGAAWRVFSTDAPVSA